MERGSEWYARRPKLALALALLAALIADGLAGRTTGYPHHLLTTATVLALMFSGLQFLFIVGWTMRRWRQRIVDEARIGYVKATEDNEQSSACS